MNTTVLRDMIVETVTAPRQSAARLIALNLPRSVLWQGLVLVVALNAIAFWLGNLAAPSPQPLPAMMATPFMFALTLGCGAVITVFALTYVGNWLKGRAGLAQILVLITWLQVLRLAVQVLATVLSIVMPGFALLVLLVVNLYGFWILVNFIDVAHGFGSPFKSFGVLMMSGLGIAVGLIVMLSLIGVTSLGVSAHV
ncbi:YIP1 family protein [Marinovum sp. 2_MG-2023]|uniref:YIP1 family protein n=1 Tax=Roseobacteraceae TaxID=2854170 RepID=UPI001FD105C6|nr:MULTISPECIES: YIP1 family protein [Roseobacteraceae]MCJ7875078.1 YIP1 family protein [Phaeobacter sp. J2-8]MDO6731919.1 YIP1 family protein [Marinovum sp. 2_MG-2023]MDO6781171.1 YIP1 family protein [Marinovum sp. 1_MG-2023]